VTPLKQQISLIPFSVKNGDNTEQQIAEMSIAAMLIAAFPSDCDEISYTTAHSITVKSRPSMIF